MYVNKHKKLAYNISITPEHSVLFV